MTSQPAGTVLEIKKYPNRRLYDATRSCHVTTGELYDLVAGGQAVRVRDSKSGDDITNQVLLQALIERDPLKVNAVPPPLIHLMIRANQQLMTSWFDQFLRWTMQGYRAAGGGAGPVPWGAGWPGGGGMWPPQWGMPGWGTGEPTASALSPMAWMESFFRPVGASPDRDVDDIDPEPDPEPEPEPEPDPGADDSDLDRLQQQVAALAEEVARLRAEKGE